METKPEPEQKAIGGWGSLLSEGDLLSRLTLSLTSHKHPKPPNVLRLLLRLYLELPLEGTDSARSLATNTE